MTKKGKGLFAKPFIRNPLNTIDIAKKLVYGRRDYSPSSKRNLELFGNFEITGMTIGRHPLISPVTWLANHLTVGEPYDKLFHLFLVVNTSQGSLLIEKNEVINIAQFHGFKQGDETMIISNFPRVTINQLLENTRRRMGDDNFFSYQASSNNCQVFILNILEANNIHSGKEFILQDTGSIFKNHPELRKTANTITDIAGRANVLLEGGSVHPSTFFYNSQKHK